MLSVRGSLLPAALELFLGLTDLLLPRALFARVFLSQFMRGNLTRFHCVIHAIVNYPSGHLRLGLVTSRPCVKKVPTDRLLPPSEHPQGTKNRGVNQVNNAPPSGALLCRSRSHLCYARSC